MKSLMQRVSIGAIVIAGVLGSVAGSQYLSRAVKACGDLYRVDIVGSQIESDLEYETQESRRAFLYALAISDPNQQLPYINTARQASAGVRSAVAQFRKLDAADLREPLNAFVRSWSAYEAARDQIVADILLGDVAMAIETEQASGQLAFDTALASLRALRSALSHHASEASARVNATLWRCALGLGAFAVSTLCIVGLLTKVNRDRQHALESLHSTNDALEAARDLAKQRASILEMVSLHINLNDILARVASLAKQLDGRSGAAIWTAHGPELQFAVAAGLPPELAGVLRANRIESEAVSNTGAAREFGLVAHKPTELRDLAFDLIGVLQLFGADGESAASADTLDQMAQLASVAIENNRLHERLAFQAQHDPLTGLPNRLLFQDRAQQAIRLATRHRSRAAVICIDLDRYKQINDTLGHRAGDDLLCEVGRRLKSSIRESDTAARIGGDEFTVLAHDINTAADAEIVAATILTAIGRPIMLGDHQVVVTATAGVSLFPEHGEDAGTLLRNADVAMYSAKRSGGNAYHLFNAASGDSAQRRLQIEQELKAALDRDEFRLEYQPLMKRNGKLNGLEALLRWKNPRLGQVSPTDFIPIAEEAGLIVEIGEWVLETACRAGSAWLRQGYTVPRIAVNVSGAQFMAKSFDGTVQRILKESGFPASKLELEITETALMRNLEQVIDVIDGLRLLGVRFTIDDFGTGYSSLSQLQHLPVDCVKIDRSFIKELAPAGAGCSALVRGIISLAHNLDLEVVAEGVETEEQLAQLASMGCDINQGFFLHRPMPPDAIEKLLIANQTPEYASPRELVEESSLLVSDASLV